MRLLPQIADAVIRRSRTVTAALLVLLVLAAGLTVWGAMHLETDYLALLPRHKPEVRVFRETVRDFGSLDYLLVLVEAPEGAQADDYENVADALAETMRASEYVSAVEYKVDMDSPLVQFMARHALLFLDADEREELEKRLSPEAIDTQIQRLRQILTTPSSSVVKRLAKVDPVGILEILRGHFVSGRSSYGIDLSQGYYLSRDRTTILLIVKPIKPAQDVSFDVDLMADMEARTAAVMQELAPDPEPTVHFGGGYVVALEDYKILKRDAVVNLTTAFSSVLLLFAFGIGRLGAVRYAALPLICGILMTGGFGALSLGSFNPATAGFAALLIGLAIDYVIVMYGRYSEERGAGQTPEQAVRVVIEQTGRSVFLGAITSSATFLALCIVDFKGLFDMGLMTGVGILLCFGCVITVLPLLLLWDGRRHHEAIGQKPVRSFGVHRIALIARWNPRLVLALSAVLTVLAILALPRVRFNHDLKALRAEGNRGVEVQQIVSSRFGGGFDYLMVITHGESLDDLLSRNLDVNQRLEQLVEEGVLAAYDSAVKYLPPRSVQESNLAWLRARRETTLSPDRIRTDLKEALGEAGFKPEPFEDAANRLVGALSIDAPITPETLRKHDLGFVVDRYLRPEGDGFKSVTYVFPRKGDFKRFVPPELKELAASFPGKVDLSGVSVISEALRGEIKRQAIMALVTGLILVALILAWDFRSLLLSGFVMAPLTCGILWMCGAMYLLDVTFNFFNVFVATMILGIGVDYGIHATHRYLEHGGRDFEGAFMETGKSIALSGFTTMLGFGSFATSHYRGLYSMGGGRDPRHDDLPPGYPHGASQPPPRHQTPAVRRSRRAPEKANEL